MAVYYSSFLLIIILNYFCKRIRLKNKKRSFTILSFAILIIVAALRKYTVGIDLAGHYAARFEVMASKSWDAVSELYVKEYDIGFRMFNWLLGHFSTDCQFFIAATSVFIYGMIGYVIYKNTETIDDVFICEFLLITLFPYFMYLTGLAQTIAICFVLLGTERLKKGHTIQFLILILIAITIHNSALCCLVLYFLYRMKYTRNSIYLSIGMTIAIYFGYMVLFYSFAKILPTFAVYTNIKFQGQGSFGLSVLSTLLSVLWIPVLAYHFIYSKSNMMKRIQFKELVNDSKNMQIKSYNVDFLMHCSILCFGMKLLSIKMLVMGRMGHYFMPFSILLVPYILRNINDGRERSIVKLAIYFLLSIYFVVYLSLWGNGTYGTFQYSFYWQ